jgi:hypothetical protein
MRNALITLALCAAAVPAGAQFTTTYTGVQHVNDKDYPATAIFAIDSGRIAMIMTGAKNVRMLFDDKAQVLRLVNEDGKQYFDITKDFRSTMDPSGQMAKMQKQLESMPKEQRAMAESMMKQAMASMSTTQDQLVYNWTTDKQRIAGYDCTRVEGMRGARKVTEYCGSTSNDLKLTDKDRQTVLDMQGYLRNFLIMVKSGDDQSTRAFAWDTSTDGYPVLTRCFDNGTMTLELTLATVNRKGPTDDQFKVDGFKKTEMPKPPGGN